MKALAIGLLSFVALLAVLTLLLSCAQPTAPNTQAMGTGPYVVTEQPDGSLRYGEPPLQPYPKIVTGVPKQQDVLPKEQADSEEE